MGMKECDYFITLNPDILLDKSNTLSLIKTLKHKQPQLATINLFLDKEELVTDDNIRLYPEFMNFIKTYLSMTVVP